MSDIQKQAMKPYYVRLQYNDKPITLPFCKQPGRHLPGDESFCSLLSFKEAMDTLTPLSWKAARMANLGANSFPRTVETPLGVS